MADENVLMYNIRTGKKLIVKKSSISKLRRMGYLQDGEKPPVPGYKKGKKRTMTHCVFPKCHVYRDEEVKKMIGLGYKLKESPKASKEEKTLKSGKEKKSEETKKDISPEK